MIAGGVALDYSEAEDGVCSSPVERGRRDEVEMKVKYMKWGECARSKVGQ